MKEQHKRSRNPKYKKKYKVTNWKEYERSLRNRGSLTLWVSPSVIRTWKPKASKRRGRQHQFSDQAIETILSLRLIFHLPLRQTEGFVTSIFQLMKLKLPVPDHTTLSRRGRTLKTKDKRSTTEQSTTPSHRRQHRFKHPWRRSLVIWNKAKKGMEKVTHLHRQ